mgnify:CR=1 FL=1
MWADEWKYSNILKNMEKIKAVIFDLDGTLGNTLPLCIQAFRQSVEPLINRSISDAEIIATFGPSEEGTTNISLKHFDLTHFFKIIETGSPSGARKSEGIQTILNSLKGLEINEVIYVGDALSDILASRKVRVPIVAAAWADTAEPEKLKELQPDELFYTIKDFKNWLLDRI